MIAWKGGENYSAFFEVRVITMKRYRYLVIVVLSAVFTAAVFVAWRFWPWWLPKFSHQLWRAATYSHGTTLFGIGLALLPSLVVLIYQGIRSYCQERWRGLEELLKKEYGHALALSLLTWLVVVVWTFFTMPLETFTPEQIADWSYGIVVPLAQNQDGGAPVASGFWADRGGHVLVCTRKLRNAPVGVVGMGVGMLAPPLFDTAMNVSNFTMWLHGRLDWYDDETGVAIFTVPPNPFQTKPWYLSVWSRPRGTGEGYHLVQQARLNYDVPAVSDSQLKPGDHIFVLAVENDKGQPILKYDDGTVERIGIEPQAGDRDLRAYTSIPFENTYVGAPVVNANEQVVGVVGDSTDKVIVVPSQYILENMQKLIHQHR
jgi:hypothetical protein